MLVRILADNPGKSFTRNIDTKFATTVKDLLRNGSDMSVQQILRETLDSFETQKADEETLAVLREMWKKEKSKMDSRGGLALPIPRNATAPVYNPNNQNYFARNHRPKGLPPPVELAQRIEEAKTSAKLLSQVVQSTAPAEVLDNELIKEFAERCGSASRSMQQYIHSDSPAPDEDTLLTLIETHDQLATAMSRHQRALLQARRVTGASSSPTANGQNQNGPFEAPTSLPASAQTTSFIPPPGPPPGRQAAQSDHTNPFADHNGADGPTGNLQAPLEPHNYGLPPASITTTSKHDTTTDRSIEDAGIQPQQQPVPPKPRYRF
ncbi:MAG: hypothetical protein Q9217_000721 [Psora testacea]